jgi:hypothetical protein
MKTLKRAWNWFYTNGRTLRFALLMFIPFGIVTCCALDGHATDQSWTYRGELGGRADSVIYCVWHGWDSLGTFTATNRDSLAFTIIIQDTTANWVDAFIYRSGLDSASSDRIVLGSPWVAKGVNVWYPIRNRWCVPPDSIIRRVWQNFVLVSTDTIDGPVYRDYDSVLISDVDVVYINTLEFWGTTTTSFDDWAPTATDSASSEIVYDTLVDTIHSPEEPVSASLCRVYGYIGELGGQWVRHASVNAVLDERVSIDTCTNILIFDRRKSVPTDVNGYFQLDLVRSKCLTDLKYTITVHKAGLEDVVRKITIPDSATYRIRWE